MEFLVISSAKIKIKLTCEEIEKYSLSEIDSERADFSARRGLWRIVDILKEKHGFSFSGEKLLVQFYKTELGGELFITKLLKQSEKNEKILEHASNVTLLHEKRKTYRFLSADSVIRVFRLYGEELSSSSELYLSDEGCYYLVVTTRKEGFSFLDHLSEYGDDADSVPFSYVIEHSKLLGGPRELSMLT